MASSREYPLQPLAGVGVVIVDATGQRVLLARRARPPLLHYWSVPGGLVELGEEVRVAAAREAREETGLEVEIGEIVAVIDRIDRDAAGRVQYHYLLVDFLARVVSGEARAASDVGEVAWVRWEDLPGYQLTPNLPEVFAQARARLGV